ncbi:hypothetical protein AB0454_22750 [Streptomyces sp. NPDC093509]|uniref:hypothetical protein n=1 Tax=Streptomyces sp. NPDC093509 TaxID=3154982 RepID=UPI00344C5AD8
MPKQRQAWHLAPERVQRTLSVLFSSRADLTMTARTVSVRCTYEGERPGSVTDNYQDRLGEVLSALYFDVERGSTYGPYQLPRPVRVVITEQAADAEQTSPSKGDRLT